MKPMRTTITITILALALASCATTGKGGTLNVPHLMLRDVDGVQHDISDYVGKKVVVMSFWATWCMPCRNELNVLQKVYAKHKEQGLEVLAIATDGPETIARVRPFVKQSRWTFHVLLDTETRASALYNPRKTMPMLHIFDRDGRIVYTHTTFQLGQAKALRGKILSVLRRGGEGEEEAEPEGESETKPEGEGESGGTPEYKGED